MRWLERRIIRLLLGALVLLALCAPCSAQRWRWSAKGISGSAETRVFGPVRMAAVDEIAEGLGYTVRQEKSELVVASGTGLRFVHGAALVWLGYSVIPLPARTRVEHGHWWIETDAALRVYSQFLKRNGRNLNLQWSGAAGPKRVDPPEPQRPKTSPPAKVVPPSPVVKSSLRLPGLKNVRWGGEGQNIRAVLDLEGDDEPVFTADDRKVTVHLSPLEPSLSAHLPVSREDVLLEIAGGNPARLNFLHPGRSAKAFVLHEPHRLVIDFKRDGASLSEVPPPAIRPPERERPPAPQPDRKVLPDKKQHPNRPATVKSKKLVVIDPGHGGKDPGAIGHGYQEKKIALEIATRIVERLRELGVNVRMTRTGDTYPSLKDRTAMANRLKADVFISIHLNALPKGRHSNGVEIYIMALPTDKDAMALAKIENAEIAEGGAKTRKKSDRRTEMLLEILGNMQQNQKISESTELAEDLFKAGQEARLDMKRVAQAPFWVLRGAAMPAVLIETGFITELAEVRRLAQPEYQQKMAEAFASGIVSFINR